MRAEGGGGAGGGGGSRLFQNIMMVLQISNDLKCVILNHSIYTNLKIMSNKCQITNLAIAQD